MRSRPVPRPAPNWLQRLRRPIPYPARPRRPLRRAPPVRPPDAGECALAVWALARDNPRPAKPRRSARPAATSPTSALWLGRDALGIILGLCSLACGLLAGLVRTANRTNVFRQ